LELIFYEKAAHGFDKASRKNGHAVRYPLVFGKKYHMKYDKNAATVAIQRVLAFYQNDR
jgi:dienelactone hydrolase